MEGPGGLATGRQGPLYFQKNEKIIRTVPILKANSTYFAFKFCFSTMNIKNFTNWGGKGAGLGWVEFIFLTYFYIISSM